ncbi:MAG: glycosyltransferase [Phormidesmis sp.]
MGIYTSDKPVVTVVIPYYQHKLFVKSCIDSVAAQRYENIQLVVIDDCSPDGSGAYVEELVASQAYKDRFHGGVIFKQLQENSGAHAAINHGIGLASGELIAIINSDDRYHRERLQRMVGEMLNQEAEFAFSRVGYIDADNAEITESHEVAASFQEMQAKIAQFPTVGFSCLPWNSSLSTGNFVFSRRLYDQVGEFQSYRYCHDWDFLLRALIYVEPLYIDEALYYYRFHGKNTFESVKDLAVFESARILKNYFNMSKIRPCENPLAPSDVNWPHYFRLFLGLFNQSRLYEEARYL